MKISHKTAVKTPIDYAFKILSIRSYSESSMAEKLIKKGFSTSQTSQTIKKLKELGYINDKAYGENMIINGKLKFIGKLKLSYEMYKKGVNRQLINELIENLYTYEEEKDIALKAINKKKSYLIKYKEDKFNALMPASDLRIYKKKLYDFLQRRGFSSNIIEDILSENMSDL